MPGFDGTGPRGKGPMTGGGRGFCRMPWGGGRGRAWGGERETYLADQLSALENEMREIKERLKELDKDKESE